MPKKTLSFPDYLTGRRVSLALVADGKLQSPAQLYAHIMRPLELMQAAAWFFARHSPGMKRHRDEPPPPLRHMLTQFSPCVPVRVMCGCVATACRRLAAAPAGVYVMCRTMWRWAAWIMERVTHGRVKKVQAAAAARVAGGPDILESARDGHGASVLCHLIADADCVNQRDTDDQQTPLHESAMDGHLEICRLLLLCSADVDAETCMDRNTPLHASTANGRLEVTRCLVESKADVAARTRRSGYSALALAIFRHKADVAAYLRSIGAPQ